MKKQIIKTYWKPLSGYFGINIQNVQWYSCRDIFLRTNLRQVIFCCGNTDKEVVVRFISDIEDVLGLKKKTVFKSTQINNVLYIIPSSFWRNKLNGHWSYQIRKSFFSMALRAGIRYDKYCDGTLGGIIATFRKSKYVRNIRAIKRFLGGHCNYTGTKNAYNFGWSNAFPSSFNQSEIKKLLVK